MNWKKQFGKQAAHLRLGNGQCWGMGADYPFPNVLPHTILCAQDVVEILQQ
jgi:hypothetical protein